jgi:hypothetical protein
VLFCLTNQDFKINCGYYNNLGKFIKLATAYQEGTTHSGDPDTTLMNTIRMVVYLDFIFNDILGLKSPDYYMPNGEFEQSNFGDFLPLGAGDDSDVIVRNIVSDEKIIEAYKQVFSIKKGKVKHGLGMVLKQLYLFNAFNSDFCSTYSFDSTERFCKTRVRVIRMPERWLRAFNLMEPTSITQEQWIKATMECNLAWGNNIFVVEEVCRKVLEQYKDVFMFTDNPVIKCPDKVVSNKYIYNRKTFKENELYKCYDQITQYFPNGKAQYKFGEKTSKNNKSDYLHSVEFFKNAYQLTYEDIETFKNYCKTKIYNRTELFEWLHGLRDLVLIQKMSVKPNLGKKII